MLEGGETVSVAQGGTDRVLPGTSDAVRSQGGLVKTDWVVPTEGRFGPGTSAVRRRETIHRRFRDTE
jgi:hypothetical protein